MLHNVYLFVFKMYSLISAIKTVSNINLIPERKKFSRSLFEQNFYSFIPGAWSNSWRNFFQFVLPLDRRKIWLLYWQCAFYFISTPFLFHSTKIFSKYIFRKVVRWFMLYWHIQDVTHDSSAIWRISSIFIIVNFYQFSKIDEYNDITIFIFILINDALFLSLFLCKYNYFNFFVSLGNNNNFYSMIVFQSGSFYSNLLICSTAFRIIFGFTSIFCET